MNEKKNYMTVREAMAEIQARTGIALAKYTFYKWLKEGTLVKRKLGKRFLIASTDLDIFLSDFSSANQDLVGGVK
jgi:hypothetical protein